MLALCIEVPLRIMGLKKGFIITITRKMVKAITKWLRKTLSAFLCRLNTLFDQLLCFLPFSVQLALLATLIITIVLYLSSK